MKRISTRDALQDIRKSEDQGAGEQENRTSGLFEWVDDWMADAGCSMLDARYSMPDARWPMSSDNWEAKSLSKLQD